jgi:phosphatidyl-myo-inositol alpha-mannosyltransferase
VRIALVHPYSWPEVRRGGERVLHDLAWALRTSGNHVEILTGSSGITCVDRIEDTPVNRRRHHSCLDRGGLGRYETFGLEAVPWLASHSVDLVVAMSPTAAIASRLCGRRTVFAPMGWPTEAWWRHRRVEGRAFRAATRVSHATTVLSHAVAESVELLTGRRPTVLPAGIRLGEFPIRSSPRSGAPIVLFASWAEERGKGLDVLLRAFDMLLRDFPDARIRLAGGGDPTWAIASLGEESRGRVTAALEIVGDEHEPISADTYGGAHVTALPSQMESFGLVLLESLACGTPVVGSAEGGLPDVIGGCETAVVVGPRDVPGLYRALVDSIVLATKPGTAAKARSRAGDFDWSTVIGPRHMAFYEQVAVSGDVSPTSDRRDLARSSS